MNITELTVHELKEKLEKKELTSYEITKAYTDRIAEKEKVTNAGAESAPKTEYGCREAVQKATPPDEVPARVAVAFPGGSACNRWGLRLYAVWETDCGFRNGFRTDTGRGCFAKGIERHPKGTAAVAAGRNHSLYAVPEQQPQG